MISTIGIVTFGVILALISIAPAFFPRFQVFIQIVGHQCHGSGVGDRNVTAHQVDIIPIVQIVAAGNIVRAVCAAK